MKKLREALLLFYNIAGQDQETRHMGYPLQNDRQQRQSIEVIGIVRVILTANAIVAKRVKEARSRER